MSERVRVDVWSDVACPWCYIGKRKFETGVGLAGVEVDVEYHAFELSPDTPVDFDGNESQFLAQHKGLPEVQARRMLDGVTAVAAEVGLEYDFEAMHHTNTVLAHELVQFAKGEGVQLEAVERLFHAYFVEGRHVGRIDDLVELAAEAGLDRDAAREALEEHRYLAAVREDQATAAELGINAVPFFVLDGRFGLAGAQSPEVFAQALQQVVSGTAEAEAVRR